jgi:hypothetical protein
MAQIAGTPAALPIGLFSFLFKGVSLVPKAPFQSRKLKADIFPKAIREQVLWGPFTLQPTAGQHRQYGLKLDKQSDVIEEALNGICRECMVLSARAEIVDNDGKKLDAKDGVYVHHILVADLGRNMVVPPLAPTGFNSKNGCPARAKGAKGAGGMSGMSGMGGMGGHSKLRKRIPQFGSLGSLLGGKAGSGTSGNGLPSGLSLFIGKGNEGDSSVFAPLNSTALKSGFWIGKNDKMTATAEVVNYRDKPKDVYFAIDMEYLKFDGGRPADYLDVGFGALLIEQCGNLFFRKSVLSNLAQVLIRQTLLRIV